MKKIITAQAVLILFSALTIVGCKKQYQQNSDANLPALSQKVANDFAIAQSNWNTYAGNLVTLKSFEVSGRINTEAERTAIIEKISADGAMAAYGNILDESTMHLNSIGELQAQNATTKKIMLSYLSKQVNVGDIVVDVQWQSAKKSFTSTCIVHDDAIAWDNLLTSTFMMDKQPKEALIQDNSGDNVKMNASKQSSKYWQTNWLWNSKRGEMQIIIKINYNGSQVYSTDHSNYAYMALGAAHSESKILNNSGSYGKVQYALGVVTPFATVTMNWGSFSVSVSGLGSSMVANGTITLAP